MPGVGRASRAMAAEDIGDLQARRAAPCGRASGRRRRLVRLTPSLSSGLSSRGTVLTATRV